MTPLTYHTIGVAVLALWFVLNRYGPADLHPVPDDSRGFRAARGMFTLLAWPVTLTWYAGIYGLRGLYELRRLRWDWVWTGYCWTGYAAIIVGIIYGLGWHALPFLIGWYGVAA